MNKNARIYVAGHRGMVGSAIVRSLKAQGYENLIMKTHAELPLDDASAVEKFFEQTKPEYVFLTAAKVGGILANSTQGADFIRENLLIQTNVIDAAYRHGAVRLLFLGSSCMYPKIAEQPLKETSLMTGALEPTTLPYATAKIAGKVMCDAYRAQYGFDAITIMPSNVYGVGDNFHPDHGHVVAGMMRRFHEAKLAGINEVVVWGTGAAMRELIDVDDLAAACVFLMGREDIDTMINVGSSEEISVRDLAHLMAKVTGYQGDIKFDTSRPDGAPRKLMDNSRIERLGWKAQTSIAQGIQKMYAWWLTTHA
ncbi:GDP-L-fucose synthase family protein [Orrella daihaiensis]|uniref:GDP-L-fucose synthase n=1 Tax=Orrella daihaiensis TaxID=2782176 RepID=A0ABY4ALH9_9BURK|nr:GDP-L-fucose synthase [Orrella daihaiensis]UOD51165.1 GDP-L-fucose synthase [Orrella daihaiensis]